MKPDPASEYEQLSPEAAARLDRACDTFENAWKAAGSVAAAPSLQSFLAGSEEPERSILLRELQALDRAYRERYCDAFRTEGRQQGGAPAAAADADTSVGRMGARVPRGQAASWPSLPGLELVEVLGSGGMGVVFRAWQPRLDRFVAVKLLRDAHAGGTGQRERFLQEARAVARLQHPNLVQLFEFGEVPSADGAASRPYLVLEYVSGGSLADLFHSLTLPPLHAARLVETLAEAIHYAHQQGVIHRDLKPANVLLAPPPLSGESAVNPKDRSPLAPEHAAPKVTDFGLAKFLTGSDLTKTGDVLGTPSYMAPEQATGKSEVISEAVDVYGLGAILYEALSGRPPFTAATAAATVRQVQEEEPAPLRRLQQAVPRDLETICLKCLRKEAARRYGSARELADDLRRFRTGEPIRARPVSAGERVLVWCRRKPLVAGLLAALVVVFVAGLAGILWQGEFARQKAAEAERNAVALKQEHNLAQLEKDRANRNLHSLRVKVDRLSKLGRDLAQQPQMHKTAISLLEEVVAFYKDIIPKEGRGPHLRLEAARMYGEVAGIYHTVGQWSRAVEAYRLQADLLSDLWAEEPANKGLGYQLAVSHRWRANVLRDRGDLQQARAAYDEAAKLQQRFLDESPKDLRAQAALANTLLNEATVFSHSDPALRERLYERIVELERAVVKAAGDNPSYQAELALGLETQGLFFLAGGQVQAAKANFDEALAIGRKLLAGGRLKGSIERYLARYYAGQAKVLAALRDADKAEQAYWEAIRLLEPLVKAAPMVLYHHADLAGILTSLAVHLEKPGRTSEVVLIRRQAIGHYEILKDRFPEDKSARRLLVVSYLELVRVLWGGGRESEAAEPYRRALEVAPEDPAVNNELAWFLATCAEPRLWNAAEAVRLARKAVAADRTSADYWNTLGAAHYRNDDNKAAIDALQKAMSLRAQGSSFDWYFLAMAHCRLGDRAKARTLLDQAVQWMDKYMPQDRELSRFRAEAEAMLMSAPIARPGSPPK
jgi:tetratricopeptide (TPR) repeat protein